MDLQAAYQEETRLHRKIFVLLCCFNKNKAKCFQEIIEHRQWPRLGSVGACRGLTIFAISPSFLTQPGLSALHPSHVSTDSGLWEQERKEQEEKKEEEEKKKKREIKKKNGGEGEEEKTKTKEKGGRM